MSTKQNEDQILDCERCGITFVWSSEEQTKAKRNGDNSLPQLCAGCRYLLPNPGRERGEVKWYNLRRHYGFIVRSSGPEIFFHRNRVMGRRRLRPGDMVDFAIEEGERGPSAVDVELVARGDDPSQIISDEATAPLDVGATR